MRDTGENYFNAFKACEVRRNGRHSFVCAHPTSRKLAFSLGNPSHYGRRFHHCSAIGLPGNSFRPRVRVPRQLLDGGAQSMEARDRLSPMGCTGALRIRRSAFYFLSSSVVDVRSRSGRDPALEGCTSRLYLGSACVIWLLHVPAGATLAESKGRCFCRS